VDSIPWFSSLWWKDITSIGENLETHWFTEQVVKRIGNGRDTMFWKDKWIGERPLMERFPRLYSITTQKDASVAVIRDGTSGWNLL
jgi:hypothetical protein